MDEFKYVVLALFVIILIWMALREVSCWYFKINESIENQKRIISLLDSIDDKLSVEEKKVQQNIKPKPAQTSQSPDVQKEAPMSINDLYAQKNAQSNNN